MQTLKIQQRKIRGCRDGLLNVKKNNMKKSNDVQKILPGNYSSPVGEEICLTYYVNKRMCGCCR